MTKELTADELADILESGKYLKTKGQLARPLRDDEVGYCCLGVYAQECGLLKSRDLPHTSWNESMYGDDYGDKITKYFVEDSGFVEHDTDLNVLAPAWMKRKILTDRYSDEPTTIEAWLMSTNDGSETWKPVVRLLRKIARGEVVEVD